MNRNKRSSSPYKYFNYKTVLLNIIANRLDELERIMPTSSDQQCNNELFVDISE